MIAPAHGVVWRSHVADILDAYEKTFTSGALQDKAIVVYDSMWGSTAKMARSICDGFLAAGISARLMDLKDNHVSDVMDDFLDARYVAVGSPTLNSQPMPQVAALLCYMRGLSPKNVGRTGIPFGSYGWAPAGPKAVAQQMEEAGFELPLDVVTSQWVPSQERLDEIREAVRKMASAE